MHGFHPWHYLLNMMSDRQKKGSGGVGGGGGGGGGGGFWCVSMDIRISYENCSWGT